MELNKPVEIIRTARMAAPIGRPVVCIGTVLDAVVVVVAALTPVVVDGLGLGLGVGIDWTLMVVDPVLAFMLGSGVFVLIKGLML